MAEDIGKIPTRECLRSLSEHQGKDTGIQKRAGRDAGAQGLECIATSRSWKVGDLLELREGKAHVRKVPVVDYDALHIALALTAWVADRRASAGERRGA